MYRWDGGSALVQTVDFFTPIVDDPYIYGQIAAANALSDVYAMGGEPRTALAIAAFPKQGLEAEAIQAIFAGGFDKLREAGTALLGGHTVQDTEIKFGYAITGAIDPARILTNAGARPGDELILTKSIGTGVVGTAIKFQRAPDAIVQEAITSMTTLNRAAADVLRREPGVHACTDVTGFGLIGHASEMAAASGVTLEIDSTRVPLFRGIHDLVRQNRSGGMQTNIAHFSPRVAVDDGVGETLVWLLYDPQTSGGLLAAVEAAALEQVRGDLANAGVKASRIGRVTDPSTVPVRVR